MKVFLSGTTFGSSWKEQIIKNLKLDYYNPENETDTDVILKEKNGSDFCLYVVTPQIKGFTTISEVADDSNKRPAKTIFCFVEKEGDKEFTKFQVKSLSAVGKLVKGNGGYWMTSLDEVINFLNSQIK
jgi:hypothetical protein